jgi:hypothetical protein
MAARERPASNDLTPEQGVQGFKISITGGEKASAILKCRFCPPGKIGRTFPARPGQVAVPED